MTTVVDFASSIQPLEALEAAAYRLIGICSCKIDERNGRYVCTLTRATDQFSESDIEQRFLAFVIDENLRLRLARETEGVRNTILALAFGALAEEQSATSEALAAEH